MNNTNPALPGDQDASDFGLEPIQLKVKPEGLHQPRRPSQMPRDDGLDLGNLKLNVLPEGMEGYDFEPIKLRVPPEGSFDLQDSSFDLPEITLKDLPQDFPGFDLTPIRLNVRPDPPSGLRATPQQPPMAPAGAPTGIPEQPKRRRPHVADNAFEDAVNFGTEIVTGIFHTAKLAYDYASNPLSKYTRDFRLLTGKGAGNLKQVGGVLLESLTENYKNDEGEWAILDAFTKRPVHTLADLAAIASLAGGGVRMAGKAAGGASHLRIPAEVAAKLPRMGMADRLVRVGEGMEKVARNIDPLVVGSKVAGKAINAIPGAKAAKQKLADWVGVGEHTDSAIRMRANEFASEDLALANDKLDLAFRHLSPQDGEAIRKAVRRGSAEDLAALTPEARNWYDSFVAKVSGEGGQEAYLTSRQLGLTDERKLRANAIAAALEEWGPDAAKSTELVDRAAAKISQGVWKPTYATLFEPQPGESLIDTLVRDYQRSRRYGRLEGRSGTGVYEQDIFKVAMRQMEAYHHTRARLRWLDRVLSYLEQRGHVKALRDLREVPEGYAVIETPILKRYFETKNRAGAVLVDALLKGKEPGQAIHDAFEKVISDPALSQPIRDANHIAVPRHVARLIDLEFTPPSGLGIVYGRLLDAWRSVAVLWRPSAWLGTAVGNGIMDLLHGVGPEDFARARKLRSLLPPEIRSKIAGFVDESDGPLRRMTQKLGDWYSALDEQITRSPIFSKEAERIRRELREGLERSGVAFFIAKETLDDPQRFAELVALGPESLSKAEQKLQVLLENIAGSVPELRTLRAEKDRVERLAAKLEEVYSGLLEKDLGNTTTLRERQLREALARLEQESRLLKAQAGPLSSELGTAVRDIRKGKSGLRKELESALRRDVHASIADVREVARDIQQRGGVRPVAITSQLPRRFRAPKGQGIPSDVLAQEMFDRGLLADASSDRLYEYLAMADGVLSGSRKALQQAGLQAQTLAAGRFRKSISLLIANSKGQARLRYQLAQIRKESTLRTRKLAEIATERKGKLEGIEARIREAQAAAGSLETILKSKQADALQQMVEAGRVRQEIPQLSRVEDWADEAIQAGNRLAGAYQRLHPLERRYMRSLVPFWTYTKTMTKLVMSLPFLYPKRTFLWNRWSQLVLDAVRDPETPEWLRDYLPIGHTADGSTVFVRLSAFVPWQGVRTADVGHVPIPSLLDVAAQNPLAKFYMELKGATPEWSKRPITPGERMVRMDSGEVYELTKDGRIRKTIAQPSIWKALWGLFPTSQLIDIATAPYVMTDRGWTLFPEPITKPDGTPLYPQDIYQRLARVAGVPYQVRNVELERRREAGREVRVVRAFREAMRRAGPEKREAMADILRDWNETRGKR